MQIITSAAYLTGDLKSEFGSIPPSFLPLKNNRLFFFQVKFLQQSSDKIYLTIPISFVIDQFDANSIAEAGVTLIRVPDNLSLSDSILYAINLVNRPEEQVMILHGDTLFTEYPDHPDTVYVAHANDNYSWGNISLDSNEDISEVYAGLFYFSHQSFFSSCLINFSNDFIASVEAYANKFPVKLSTENTWMDFGHTNTYFRSKAKMTTERVFNNLSIDQYTVKKFSDDRVKMMAEANWFSSIPARLKKYSPTLIDIYSEDRQGYELDYLYLNTLAELYVFGQNDAFVWSNIFKSCENFINDCLSFDAEAVSQSFDKEYRTDLLDKTRERLVSFSKQTGISINKSWKYNGVEVPSLVDIADLTSNWIDQQYVSGYVHGDFCFSNILFDFRKQMIKVIDPRGVDFKKNITIRGDLRYDIAKLSHSVIGLYDYIIAGRFSLDINISLAEIKMNIYSNKTVVAIQEEFLKIDFAGIQIGSKQNYALMIHLFLSMLPLHADNEKRQLALMSNVFRLYQNFEKL